MHSDGSQIPFRRFEFRAVRYKPVDCEMESVMVGVSSPMQSVLNYDSAGARNPRLEPGVFSFAFAAEAEIAYTSSP